MPPESHSRRRFRHHHLHHHHQHRHFRYHHRSWKHEVCGRQHTPATQSPTSEFHIPALPRGRRCLCVHQCANAWALRARACALGARANTCVHTRAFRSSITVATSPLIAPKRVAPSPRRALWRCACVGNAIGHLVFTSHGRPFGWRGVAWRCGRPSLSRTTRGEAPRPPSLLSSLGGVAFCAARQTGPCEPPLPLDRSPNCRGFLPMSPFPIPPIIPRPSLSLPLAAPMLRRRCTAARFRGAAVARPSSTAG